MWHVTMCLFANWEGFEGSYALLIHGSLDHTWAYTDTEILRKFGEYSANRRK